MHYSIVFNAAQSQLYRYSYCRPISFYVNRACSPAVVLYATSWLHATAAADAGRRRWEG